MNSLEMTKLRLLSHSKNMLDAAQQSDWTRLSALENGWTGLLQSSVNQYGDALMQTGLEILKDNQKITLDDINDSEILLNPISSVWNDANYLNSEYKISLTTTRGNFFTTVASPFNT